jgi:hypothetical protein
MAKFHALLIGCCLFAPAAYAATLSPDAISKAVGDVANDASKTKAYCEMSKKMDEIGDDEKKAEAAGDQIDGYFKTLGQDFENAWDAGQDAADGSAEAKAFEEAMTKLDEKCK